MRKKTKKTALKVFAYIVISYVIVTLINVWEMQEEFREYVPQVLLS